MKNSQFWNFFGNTILFDRKLLDLLKFTFIKHKQIPNLLDICPNTILFTFLSISNFRAFSQFHSEIFGLKSHKIESFRGNTQTKDDGLHTPKTHVFFDAKKRIRFINKNKNQFLYICP